ncbi:HD domain-containing protein [bacterium]|nr:HD domain-containing protein [bacterium]
MEDDHLEFRVSQCTTLRLREGAQADERAFKPFKLPLSRQSLAGYVAITGKLLNIPDAYAIPPDAPYQPNRSFDEKNNYRTRSMLVIPMTEPQGRVVGVLQLINAMNGRGEPIPFDPQYEEFLLCLASQAAVAVSNAQLNRAIKDAHYETIYRLAVAAEYKDHDTGAHIKRVSEYSGILAARIGMSPEEVELIRYASPMHDVGKLRIPDAILLKPGKLDPEERAEMERHTVYGGEILANPKSEVIAYSERIARSHHEKWNGTGYPRKLAGEAIPIEGRIVALADVFDALASPRCYKPAFSLDKVISIIREEDGRHFDPRLVEAFFDSQDQIMQIHARYTDTPGQSVTEIATAGL